MRWAESYRLRLRRKRFRLRALRKGRELRVAADRTAEIRPDDILLFATVRNERARLPWFMDYYRRLGVAQFLIVDNGSDDGSTDWLGSQADVSLWRTDASYRASRYGVDWLNRLRWRHGHGHWCLTVDVDEFLIYPFCDTRPLSALTDWLDASGVRSFGTILLDTYPEAPGVAPLAEGQDPVEAAPWFDPGNYRYRRNEVYQNLWIQGGPRDRALFPHQPDAAPALNKIPLVRWDRRYAYVSSTHMLLPRGLNHVFDVWGGEKASGVLLHAKFTGALTEKAAEERERREHYAGGREYAAWERQAGRSLWCRWSERYANWRQLEVLGLMSSGNWA